MNVNERIQTGIPGLDHVLGGGLRTSSIYLLRGASGTGKTTLGLQFVLEGVRRGERCLYLTLSETRGQLDMIARFYGWTLEGVEVHDLARRDDADERRSAYTVFRPAEVELEELSRAIQEQLARVQPARLVLDALSELRLLSDAPFRYRCELIALSDRVLGCNCTGWLLDTDGLRGVQ
jgi:circadian clock protein KaiC